MAGQKTIISFLLLTVLLSACTTKRKYVVLKHDEMCTAQKMPALAINDSIYGPQTQSIGVEAINGSTKATNRLLDKHMEVPLPFINKYHAQGYLSQLKYKAQAKEDKNKAGSTQTHKTDEHLKNNLILILEAFLITLAITAILLAIIIFYPITSIEILAAVFIIFAFGLFFFISAVLLIILLAMLTVYIVRRY